MKQAVYILICLLSLSAAGCSDRGGDKSAGVPAVVDTAETYDAAAPDTVSEVPPLHFEDISELREYIRESEDREEYREGIIPRMAEYSLEYATKLLDSKYDRFIIVDKSRMKVILYDRFGREEKTYSMGCAKRYGTKHKKADSRTPEGFFSVAGIYNSTDWLYRDDNGVESKKKGQFGPRFIRLRIPGTTQIGIHGTCAPWTIGSRVSHGCIRIRNEEILELAETVETGMPVIVVPGRKDMLTNTEEGHETVWVPSTLTAQHPLSGADLSVRTAEPASEGIDSVSERTQETDHTPLSPAETLTDENRIEPVPEDTTTSSKETEFE